MKSIEIRVTDRQHANLTKAAAAMGAPIEEAVAIFANSAEAGSRPPIVETHADPKAPEVTVHKHADGTGSVDIEGETLKLFNKAAKASGKSDRAFLNDLILAKIEEEKAARTATA